MTLNWKRKGNKEILQEVKSKGLPFLTFPLLEETGTVIHGFSTRMGGVSEGKYSTLNFAFTCGDHPAHVMENYRRMAGALDTEVSRMVLTHQTHTTHVRVVTEEDGGKCILRERDYTDVDGLITNVPGLTLVTLYADCVPLYLVDPVHRAIGLSHSGWRGTVGRMGKVTMDAMARTYGSRPEDMLACIGPSICQDCYEVGEEVAVQFRDGFREADWPLLLLDKGNGSYQLNLWKANEIIFMEAGITPGHLQTTDLCTHCNPDYLFSHRACGFERGNLGAFLCLKE